MIDRDMRMQCVSFAVGMLSEAERSDITRVLDIAERLAAFVNAERPRPILVLREDAL